MSDRQDVSLRTRRTAQGVVLVDHACGGCAACAAGATLWCLHPTVEGHDLSPEVPLSRAADLVGALLAVAALQEVPASETVLVHGDADGATAMLVRSFAAGRVVVASDLVAVRDELATETTGRAAVVVAGKDARGAVRAVRRGGHVCVADPTAVLPSVTELVQREVTLVGPLDVVGVARRVDAGLWAAAAAA